MYRRIGGTFTKNRNMKTVYLLRGEAMYEEPEFIGVYQSREAAQKEADRLQGIYNTWQENKTKTPKHLCTNYSVTDCKLIEDRP